MARKLGWCLEFHFWSGLKGIWTKHVLIRKHAGRYEVRQRHNGIDKNWRYRGRLLAELDTEEKVRAHFLAPRELASEASKAAGSGWKEGPPRSGSAPSLERLRRVVMMDENAPTPCPEGCEVEPDGQCEHGFAAWTRLLGIV